jgi:hypothetical protein
MPKFYFHIRRDEEFMTDAEGVDLPDVEAARREGLLAAREMLAEMILHNEVVDGQEFQITDEWGVIVATIPFRSAIRDA